MQQRIVVVLLFLGISLVPVRTASAGGNWAVAFMQWLENLHPGPYSGVFGEWNKCVALSKRDQGCNAAITFKALRPDDREAPRARLLISFQGGFAAENTKSEGLDLHTTIFPLTQVVQYIEGRIGIGGGIGELFMNRVQENGTKKDVVHTTFGVLRLSYFPFTSPRLEPISFQGDLYLFPGFDAGVFGNPEPTGSEKKFSISLVYRFKK